jgi:DNA-binding GntR family transcriptional regulator
MNPPAVVRSATPSAGRAPLTAIVRDEIIRMIENGALAPGVWVNEADLAARLGVSRAPIREACRGLEQSGLLSFVVNRGAFVREIDRVEAAELYDLRSALFALAGRELAPTISEKQLQTLAKLLDDMDAAAVDGDLDVYYPLNLLFHQTLLEFTGNKRLLLTYQSIIRELHLFRRKALVTRERMSDSNAEHRAIYAALGAKNPIAAASLMEAHVLNAKKRIFQTTPSREADG